MAFFKISVVTEWKRKRQEGKGRLRVGVRDALNRSALKKRGAPQLKPTLNLLPCLNTCTVFSKQSMAKSPEKSVNRQINSFSLHYPSDLGFNFK